MTECELLDMKNRVKRKLDNKQIQDSFASLLGAAKRAYDQQAEEPDTECDEDCEEDCADHSAGE